MHICRIVYTGPKSEGTQPNAAEKCAHTRNIYIYISIIVFAVGAAVAAAAAMFIIS